MQILLITQEDFSFLIEKMMYNRISFTTIYRSKRSFA